MDVLEILKTLVNQSFEGPVPYLILGVVVFFIFVEQWLLFSLLSPGSWGIIFVSFLAFSGLISVPVMIVMMFAAAFAGTHLQYLVGKWRGDWFLQLINRFPKLLDLEQVQSARVNPGLVVLSYSLPQIRGLVPFVAGTSQMPLGRWYVASSIGIVIWLTTFVGLGMSAAYLFNGDFEQALDWLWAINTNSYLSIVFWGITIALAVYVIAKYRARGNG